MSEISPHHEDEFPSNKNIDINNPPQHTENRDHNGDDRHNNDRDDNRDRGEDSRDRGDDNRNRGDDNRNRDYDSRDRDFDNRDGDRDRDYRRDSSRRDHDSRDRDRDRDYSRRDLDRRDRRDRELDHRDRDRDYDRRDRRERDSDRRSYRDSDRRSRRGDGEQDFDHRDRDRDRDRDYLRPSHRSERSNGRSHQSSLRDLPSSGPNVATDKEYKDAKDLQCLTTFEQMHLNIDLMKGLNQFGISKPSSVQQRVMLPVLQGRDVIAQAPSGTGKTTIFTIAMLQLVDTTINAPQALALFPTRELAQQTLGAMKAMGSYMNVKAHVCIGGNAVGEDTAALSRGAHIVTGTPGRVLDLIKRGVLDTKMVKCWIIDEADEMLSKGFQDQIYHIYRFLPEKLQIMLVSATLPNQVLALTSKFMQNPVRILVQRDELSLDGIQQFFINVDSEDWKFDTLIDLYSVLTTSQTVIFVNNREKCEQLSQKLRDHNFTVDHMHGGMTQLERDTVMTNFRSARSRVLVATDIWGRGIDVQQVSIVINYDIPTSREAYLHRIGRSGRFGKKGLAINFCRPDERQVLDDIANYYAIVINEMPVEFNE